MVISRIPKAVKILVVEDSVTIFHQIKLWLEASTETNFVVRHAPNLATGIKLISLGYFEVILLDLGLPDSQGLDTFVKMQKHASHLSIVVFSGTDDEAIALEALRMGAQDYLVKGNVNAELVRRAIYHAIERKKLVSALKRSQEELVQRTAQLIQTEKMTSVGELASGVAHELNQPLNAIRIACQDLLRDTRLGRFDPATLPDYLEDMVEEVKSMSEIINLMRVFSRRSTDKRLKKIPSTLPIDRVLKMIGQQLRNSHIDIIEDTHAEIFLLGDTPGLEQVIFNLIVNARDAVFERPHPQGMKIYLRTYRHKDEDSQKSYGVLEVRDNGPGMPDVIKNKIFEPFFSGKEVGQGTGLGLSVAREIVNEHNGRIIIDTKEGSGTTVSVYIPTGE